MAIKPVLKSTIPFKGKPWYPRWPFVSLRSKKHVRGVEREIIRHTLNFNAEAKRLIMGGCDYNELLRLGRKRRCTGRLWRMIAAAENTL